MSSCSLCLPPPFVHQREGEAKESASLAPPTHRVVPTHPPTRTPPQQHIEVQVSPVHTRAMLFFLLPFCCELTQ